MALVKPFFRHQVATGLVLPAVVPERYPYHDQEECPEGRDIKASGEWQYYQPTPETQREQCPVCARLARNSVPVRE